MATVRESTFIIKREDRALDAKTVISDGLRIGRWPDSDVWLNHPKVSRLHAGISQIEGYFYIVNLSASSGLTLNGRPIPFNEADALASGDELQIGPFFLNIENIERVTQKLTIRVGIQFGLNVGEREAIHKLEAYETRSHADRGSGPLKITGPLVEPSKGKTVDGEVEHQAAIANALRIFWEKRTREKAGRPSPLHPRKPPHLGKARFNWVPTRDLSRPWPVAIFVWAAIGVAAFSTIAAFAHRVTFAPGPISDSHTRKSFVLTPAIATTANNEACTSCHAVGVSVTNKQKMNEKCETCHKTEAFVPTIIAAHRTAGITCTTCHGEHRGKQFSPVHQALESCSKCHNDENRKTYNGKRVSTPHGGTYGYPVQNGVWIWKGYDAEQLAHKSQILAFLKQNRANPNDEQQWRNAQFHGIHLHRVRVVAGVDGVDEGDGQYVLSCTSCHKSGYVGASIDRNFPRTTCARCHNTKAFKETSLIAGSEQMSCTSCHVQHVKDPHWASSFLSTRSSEKRGQDQ
jgi:pSer/pThr/pTyr-binding forkhead associated (FHA) protein